MMDMDSTCVYEDKTVIHELTQGLQMAQQLRVNLHSPEARDSCIKMILSSYFNALYVLRSGYSSGLPSLPESLISFGSPGTKEFKFDQPFSCQQGENVIPRKRKGSTTWEDQARVCKVQKCFATKQVQKMMPYHHQLSPQSPGETLSNLRANLSVNTSDLRGDSGNIPTLSSVPSSSFGPMEDYQQLQFPNYHEDEFTPIYSPLFISPVTSESTMFTEWGSSQSLDFLDDPAYVDTDFDFDNSLF